jgi:hypothetical protein
MNITEAIALLENSIPVLRDFDDDEHEALEVLIEAAQAEPKEMTLFDSSRPPLGHQFRPTRYWVFLDRTEGPEPMVLHQDNILSGYCGGYKIIAWSVFDALPPVMPKGYHDQPVRLV